MKYGWAFLIVAVLIFIWVGQKPAEGPVPTQLPAEAAVEKPTEVAVKNTDITKETPIVEPSPAPEVRPKRRDLREYAKQREAAEERFLKEGLRLSEEEITQLHKVTEEFREKITPEYRRANPDLALQMLEEKERTLNELLGDSRYRAYKDYKGREVDAFLKASNGD